MNKQKNYVKCCDLNYRNNADDLRRVLGGGGGVQKQLHQCEWKHLFIYSILIFSQVPAVTHGLPHRSPAADAKWVLTSIFVFASSRFRCFRFEFFSRPTLPERTFRRLGPSPCSRWLLYLWSLSGGSWRSSSTCCTTWRRYPKQDDWTLPSAPAVVLMAARGFFSPLWRAAKRLALACHLQHAFLPAITLIA